MLSVHYKVGKKVFTEKFEITSEQGLFLIDMLRNEKPIFWNESRNILQTGSEAVGEGEG